jgi:hypothetical protein
MRADRWDQQDDGSWEYTQDEYGDEHIIINHNNGDSEYLQPGKGSSKITAEQKKKMAEPRDQTQAWLDIAQNLQDFGDVTALVGYGAAVIGSPIAGIGAAPGLAVATTGNVISGLGTGIEIVVNFSSGNEGEATKDVAIEVGALVLDAAVDKAIPGPTPDFTSETRKILRQGATTKTTIAKRTIERVTEDE